MTLLPQLSTPSRQPNASTTSKPADMTSIRMKML
jgi:hypothetical protein